MKPLSWPVLVGTWAFVVFGVVVALWNLSRDETANILIGIFLSFMIGRLSFYLVMETADAWRWTRR